MKVIHKFNPDTACNKDHLCNKISIFKRDGKCCASTWSKVTCKFCLRLKKPNPSRAWPSNTPSSRKPDIPASVPGSMLCAGMPFPWARMPFFWPRKGFEGLASSQLPRALFRRNIMSCCKRKCERNRNSYHNSKWIIVIAKIPKFPVK